YAYDCQHRLIKVEKPDGSSAEYRYDAFGRRIHKAVTDKTGQTRQTEFLWQGDKLLAESGEHHYQTYLYEYGSFKPLALVTGEGADNATPYFYHLDQIGTPLEITDAEGRVTWSVDYHSYGNVAYQRKAEIVSPLRFQGQYYDAETGLHYNRHRYYSPGTGRFITPDPIGLAGGLNNYQYVKNPTGWVDPLGLSQKPCCGPDISNSEFKELTREQRQQLIAQKVELNAERWVREYEVNLGQSYPGLNPHFVDKHGPDIPLRPNLASRAIDGSHPRTGAPGRFPQPSSQFKDWQTQRNIINEAITREARGLPKYNGFDSQGNPVVTGTYHETVGRGFTKNRQNLSQPHFNPNYTKWTIRFDAGTGQPFTGYPTP
ncbi:RHS repeat domain-containing protein, partial [Vibrio rhizosphaerae]